MCEFFYKKKNLIETNFDYIYNASQDIWDNFEKLSKTGHSIESPVADLITRF